MNKIITNIYNNLSPSFQEKIKSFLNPNKDYSEFLLFTFLYGLLSALYTSDSLFVIIIESIILQTIFIYINTYIPDSECYNFYNLFFFLLSISGWFIGKIIISIYFK
jgi:hypothetical protein